MHVSYRDGITPCTCLTVAASLKRDLVALGESLAQLAQHLLVPALPEPNHLVDDALERRQQRRVEVAQGVHDLAAPPHLRVGADRPRVALTGSQCGAWERNGN